MAEISMLEALGDVMRAGKEYTNSKQVKDDELTSAIENVYGEETEEITSINEMLNALIKSMKANKKYTDEKYSAEVIDEVDEEELDDIIKVIFDDKTEEV